MNRRDLLTGVASVSSIFLAGCATRTTTRGSSGRFGDGGLASFNYPKIYGKQPQEKFPLPAIDLKRVPKKYWRRQVKFRTKHPVGTVIVNTRTFFLHLVQENGKAMRYGVGLGRQGFEWSGQGTIQWKQKWPKWTPPDEMVARQPELKKWSIANGGMPPGLSNPLGARALYIFQNGEDTLYRIHGSPEYWTIGKAVSSGCVRMMNQDVVDLYNRVPNGGALVVV